MASAVFAAKRVAVDGPALRASSMAAKGLPSASCHYEGRNMRTAHAGMNINEQELVAAIDDIVAAPQGQGVGAAEVGEVVAILYSLKGEVLRL